MDKSKVSELCELTKEQKKAFKKLKAAYNNCIDSGVFFHQVLSSLYALNGNNIEDIDDNSSNGFCIQYMDLPSMSITAAWADDTHYVHLREGCEEEAE